MKSKMPLLGLHPVHPVHPCLNSSVSPLEKRDEWQNQIGCAHKRSSIASARSIRRRNSARACSWVKCRCTNRRQLCEIAQALPSRLRRMFKDILVDRSVQRFATESDVARFIG
jgi:hypothetical protein